MSIFTHTTIIEAMRVFFAILIILVVALTSPGTPYAQAQQNTFFYEEPTFQAFSKLYWSLDHLNINNENHVDNYMMINECDLYREYYSDEFQWKHVRKSARDFLRTQKDEFPIRFEFVRAINLGDYNIKTELFSIPEDSQITGNLKFLVSASDSVKSVCGQYDKIADYSDKILIELSRPIELSDFRVEPNAAQNYISMKLQKYKKLKKNHQTRENIYRMRDAYHVLQVRFFASQGYYKRLAERKIPHLNAVVEGVEIYGDKDRTFLLYKESFIKRRKKSTFELNLIEEYKAYKKARFERIAAEQAAQKEQDDAVRKEGKIKKLPAVTTEN